MTLFQRLATGALIVAGSMALAFPVVMTEGAMRIHNRPAAQPAAAGGIARETGASWQAVSVTAEDAVLLAGWWLRPAQPNGGAAVLFHGVGDTRLGMGGHALYLLRNGYAVLMPDARGHGASGGDVISYGIREAADVHRWVEWLATQPGVDRIYGLGESMGAAILLQSLPREPRFRAVVAECPFATFEEIAYYRLAQLAGLGHAEAWPVVRLGFSYANFRYGVDLWKASPAIAVRDAKIPILLIHGTADTNIPPRQSRELHALNPAGTKLWEVPGATHVAALSAEPIEYPRRVCAWFGAH